MTCDNCGAEIDFEFIVEEEISEFLENSDSPEEVKDFLDNDYDFGINMACDVCYHTKWVKGSDRDAYYKELERVTNG